MMNSNQKSLVKRRRQSACSVEDVLHKEFQGGSKEHHRGLQKIYKQPNVTMTMTYLGQGLVARSLDEMKVLQQICGGENVCVFRGYLRPGERFQFVSRRHRGFPFSVSLFVNGIMTARISSCCEYRYCPGFQQGSRSCFRLTDLSGGIPCYRCVSIHNKNGKRRHLSHGMNEKLLVSTVGRPAKGEEESCPSSPLFIPNGQKIPSFRLSRKCSKDVNGMLNDSEDINSNVIVNRGSKEAEKQHCNRRSIETSDMEENLIGDHVMAGKKHGVHIRKLRRVTSNKKETCKMEQGTSMTVEERHELWEETSVGYLCGETSSSDLELSDESESILDSKNTSLLKSLRGEEEGHNHVANRAVSTFGSSGLGCSNSSDLNQLYTERKEMTPRPMNQEISEKENLETQVEAMISKLESCDLVEQLVLRNTGLTDELLNGLVTALKNSPSEVVLINLNLNNIGPPGVQILLSLIRLKPQVKGLLLFGNQLGDEGACTLLNGLADLQSQTVGQSSSQLWSGDTQRMDTSGLPRETPRQSTPLCTHITQGFVLFELDLGGNGVSCEGLRVLSSYLKNHSQLKYLGLAKTSIADISAWENLFDSLITNVMLTHIILDECHLGDQGVEQFAKMLRYNKSLTKIDLDYNSIGERGGNAIIESMLGRFLLLSHLSLEGNNISIALMNKIQQQIQLNLSNNYKKI